MRLAVIGGGLQGLEAAYLAGKAGWEVHLADRRPVVPAAGLSSSFALADAADPESLDGALSGVDCLLPAFEDLPALEVLAQWAAHRDLPLAFDLEAYRVTRSKKASHGLFERLGLALPKAWPGCAFPVLAKPDASSGSRGVRVFEHEPSLRGWLESPEGPKDPCAWVLQEFLSGPSFSIEVLGRPGAYRPLQVTELAMDAGYDCKRVRAPGLLAAHHADRLARAAVSLAEALRLRGLMDLEAILHDDALTMLEIDARLPSQTPIAVFWSTGYNMVEVLVQLFRSDAPPPGLPSGGPRRSVILEHVHAHDGLLEVSGEHVLVGRPPMRVFTDFFGADEAISDYEAGKSDWAATLITTGSDRREAQCRREAVMAAIRRSCGLGRLRDPEPAL